MSESENRLQIHFINEDNSLLTKRLAYFAPRPGDEIRIGGEGSEKFYTIGRVVWVYEEPEYPFSRLNVGVSLAT